MILFGAFFSPHLFFSFSNRGGRAEQRCKEDACRMKESNRMQNNQEVTVVFAEGRETVR